VVSNTRRLRTLQVRDRDALLERCASELRDLRQQLAAKDVELARLKTELNSFLSKLKTPD